MTPLPEHEYFKQSIGLAVNDIAEALEMDYDSYRSTTWKKELKKAVTIHLLNGVSYRESPTSLAFPQLPIQELPQLLLGTIFPRANEPCVERLENGQDSIQRINRNTPVLIGRISVRQIFRIRSY